MSHDDLIAIFRYDYHIYLDFVYVNQFLYQIYHSLYYIKITLNCYNNFVIK